LLVALRALLGDDVHGESRLARALAARVEQPLAHYLGPRALAARVEQRLAHYLGPHALAARVEQRLARDLAGDP